MTTEQLDKLYESLVRMKVSFEKETRALPPRTDEREGLYDSLDQIREAFEDAIDNLHAL